MILLYMWITQASLRIVSNWHNIGQEYLDDILNSPKNSSLSSMSEIKDL